MAETGSDAAFVDADLLSRELLRALRGKRSQRAFARRIGRASNVAYAWESGRRSPSVSETLRVAAKLGHDVERALGAFAAAHAPKFRPTSRIGAAQIGELLRHLAGTTPISTIAERAGTTRSTTSRWLSGRVEPRLPDFLRLLEATCRGALTFVAALVPPLALPSVADRWQREQAFAPLVRDAPAVLVVLVGLALREYRALARHSGSFLADRTGLPAAEIDAAIGRLAAVGAIQWDGSRWFVDPAFELDTRRVPEIADHARRYFARLGAERVGRSEGERFAYVCLTASEAEIEQLLRAQAEMMALTRSIAVSDTSDRLVLVNVHVLPLDTAR
jgi:transcriptional regulator with XRE-family HTH domain